MEILSFMSPGRLYEYDKEMDGIPLGVYTYKWLIEHLQQVSEHYDNVLNNYDQWKFENNFSFNQKSTKLLGESFELAWY